MTQASQTTNYTFSLLMMSSLQNFSCIWFSSKQNSRAQCFSPNGHKFLQKISGCSGPGAIIQRVQSVIFHLGNYRGDIFIIKLREDPRNGWCVDWGSAGWRERAALLVWALLNPWHFPRASDARLMWSEMIQAAPDLKPAATTTHHPLTNCRFYETLTLNN